MIEIARRKASAGSVENVTFEQSSVEDLKVADQTLDAVLAMLYPLANGPKKAGAR